MNYDIIVAIFFFIILSIILIKNRKNLKIEKILFPVVYMILYRTRVGLKFMDKISKKFRKSIKIFGYISIGVGFLGMALMFFLIVWNTINLIIKPEITEGGIALVLPFTTIPGIGYLPFTQWILAIIILAIIHEFSHGIVAKAHNLKLKSSGFAVFSIFIPLIPAAFVEPDEKKLRNKPAKVQNSVFSAGPMSNIVLAGIILLLFIFVMIPIQSRMTEPIGFTFDVLNETSPAAKAGLETGMIIKSFNDKNVTDAHSFVNYMYYNSSINETIVLGTENQTFNIVTEKIDNRSMIGVYNVRNEVRFKEKFLGIKDIFLWFYSFLRILGLFNFFIGLFNLLPLGIVDGGRMIKVSLEKFMKKEKAMKIFTLISTIVLVSILLGLVVQYIGNPFLFFR